jgi:hypothetical protein
MLVNETYARIGEYITSHESETYSQIAGTLGLSRATVARIARLQGIRRRAGRRSAALLAAVAAIDAASVQQVCKPTSETAPLMSMDAAPAVPDPAPTDAPVLQ